MGEGLGYGRSPHRIFLSSALEGMNWKWLGKQQLLIIQLFAISS
jgi:hypothetical protein